jgi:hypothetical protein
MTTQNYPGSFRAPDLDIALPLVILPCIVLDCLCKLENANTAARLFSASRFDDCLPISQAEAQGDECMPKASKGSSLRFRFMRRIVYDWVTEPGTSTSIVKA